jgi:hypothetical protein
VTHKIVDICWNVLSLPIYSEMISRCKFVKFSIVWNFFFWGCMLKSMYGLTQTRLCVESVWLKSKFVICFTFVMSGHVSTHLSVRMSLQFPLQFYENLPWGRLVDWYRGYGATTPLHLGRKLASPLCTAFSSARRPRTRSMSSDMRALW